MGKYKKSFINFLLIITIFIGTLTNIANANTFSNELNRNNQQTNRSVGPPQGNFEIGDISTEMPQTSTLVIHKIKSSFFNKEGDKKIPFNHNGGKLSIGQLNDYGENIDGLNGVKFKYWKINDEILKDFQKNPSKFANEDAVLTYFNDVDNATKIVDINKNATETEATKTVGNEKGVVEISNLKEGIYWFIESSYTKDTNDANAPDMITSSFAIPFAINLPFTNITDININDKNYPAGTVFLNKVHVYPKNTATNEPQIEKYVTEVEQKKILLDLKIKHGL